MDETSSEVTNGGSLRYARAAGFLTLASGLLHMGLTPLHAEHALAHGLVLGGIGLAQMLYAVLFLWRPNYWLACAGILMNAGSVMLWTITRIVRAPFSDHREDVLDVYGLGLATKVVEFAAVAVLVLYARRSPAAAQQPMGVRAPMAVLLVGFLLGYCGYGGAIVSEGTFPDLNESDHGHEEGDHEHGTPLTNATKTNDPHAGHTMTTS